MSPGTSSPLTRFIHFLMRDHLPVGTVQLLAYKAQGPVDTSVITLTPYLEDMADALAESLTKGESGAPGQSLSAFLEDNTQDDLHSFRAALRSAASRGFKTKVILLHPEFYGFFRTTLTPDWDRETERRLLSLGVVGYLALTRDLVDYNPRTAVVILNRQVPPDPGFILL